MRFVSRATIRAWQSKSARCRDLTQKNYDLKLRSTCTSIAGIANSAFPSAAKLLLTEGKLFFPSPADFNDPFDCKFEMTFNASWLKRQRYARELLREKAPREMPKHIRKKIVKRGLSKESYTEAAHRFRDRLRREVGILSMSAQRDNILLWSHYANKHTGVCLELKRADNLRYAVRVSYSEESPTLDFFEIERAIHKSDELGQAAKWKFIGMIYLTKAKDWEYEQEWRLIDATRRGLRAFPSHLVSGVILGSRTVQADKEMVQRWIAQGEARPKLYQAHEAKDSYCLEIAELSPNDAAL